MASRYTDADKAKALEVLKAEGLTAAAKSSGASKSTVLRWARAAGLDPADYADRSTEQNRQAAEASAAARRRTMLENRAKVSDLLLERLAPKSAAILADRLDEDAELTDRLRDAETKLEMAIIALEACGTPPEGADIEERKRYADARKQARAAVQDAMLIRRAWADSRIAIRDLVGILTRALGDHLSLEGEAAAAAAADTDAGLVVVFTAPRPDRKRPADVITLEPTTK